MPSSASLATSHTAQRFAGGRPSSPPQTARTSPDENHKPHPAVLLRGRRDGGGTGLRCHSWPSVQPPRRTHSRAAAIPFPRAARHSSQAEYMSERRETPGRAGAASPAANLCGASVRRSSPSADRNLQRGDRHSVARRAGEPPWPSSHDRGAESPTLFTHSVELAKPRLAMRR